MLLSFKVRIYSTLGDLTIAECNKHPHFQDINEAISKEMNANYKTVMEKCEIKSRKVKAIEYRTVFPIQYL